MRNILTKKKRNANALYSVLNNIDTLEAAYKTASTSQGSAQKEMENFSKSIEFSLGRLSASWQEFQANLLNSQLVKDVVDVGNVAVNVLDKITTGLGGIIPLLTTIGGIIIDAKSGKFGDNFVNDIINGLIKSTTLDASVISTIIDIPSEYIQKAVRLNELQEELDQFREDYNNLINDYINKSSELSNQEISQTESINKTKEALQEKKEELRQNISNTEAEIEVLKQDMASEESYNEVINMNTYQKKLNEIASEERATTIANEVLAEKQYSIAEEQATRDIIAENLAEGDNTIAVMENTAAKIRQKITVMDNAGTLTNENRALMENTARLLENRTAALKAQQASSGFGNVLKNLVTQGLTYAAFWAIGKVISFVGEKIHEATHAVEIAAEKAKEARKQIDEINSAFKDSVKTTNNVKQRYAELAQGIANLGTAFQSQGNLSTDEYQEFLDLSNQLAELYPSLARGYTDNKDAILNLSGSVDTIVGSLDNLIDRSKTLARMKINEQMQNVWTDNMNVINQAQKELLGGDIIREDSVRDRIKGYKETLEDYEALYKQINNSPSRNVDNLISRNIYNDLVNEFDELYPELSNKFFSHLNSSGRANFGVLGSEGLEQLRGWLQRQIQEYSNLVQQSEDKIAQINAEMQSQLITYLSGDLAYAKLDKNDQLVVNAILQNFDMSNLPDDVDSWDKLTQWYHDNIINAIGKIDSKDIQNNLAKLFSGEGTYAEAQELYKIIYDYLIGQEIFNPDDPLIAYMRLELEGQQQDVLDAATKLTNNVDKERKASYGKFFNDFLSKQDDAFVAWVKNDLTIPDNVIYTTQELLDLYDEWIKKSNQINDSLKERRTAVDAVDTFSQTKQALSSLSELYEQVVTNGEFANPEYINSVESAFGGIAEESPIVAQALTNFENVLLEFPGDSEKAQDAINKLVSAYIDESDILKDLTEDNKEWKIATLEAMGITNAEDVVVSRLTATVKASIQVLSALRDELTKFHEIERQEDKNPLYDERGFRKYSEEYVNALNELKDKIKDALTVYDEEGQEYYKHLQLSDTFVKTHLADIQAMAEGDEEALKRVKLAASKETLGESLLEVTPTLSTEEIDSQVNTLANYFQNIPDMEIGASLNEGEFINGLNNILASGKYTADQVSEFMKSMGYDVQIDQAKSKVIVPNPNGSHMTTVYGGANAGSAVSWDTKEMEVSFPSVKIITKKGSYGGGVQADMANYKPPKENTSGGGGSGDNTDKLTEQMDVLKWLYDNDVIDYKHYLDQKKILLDRALAEGLIDQKRYFEEIHSWLREMLDLYNSAISYITKQLDKEIDRLEEERDKRLEEIEKEKDAAIEAVDSEIDAVDKLIKKKQEVIDELEKENERRKESMALQRAEYELQRSLHQRTNLVYQEGADSKGQLVYKTDPQAIRSAQEEVDEQNYQRRLRILQEELEVYEKQREELEQKKSDIEEYYNKLTEETNEYYDEAIKGIQEYKKQWEELAELEEQVKMQVTLESLGISLEQILSMDQGTFEAFKQNYIGILGDIYRENGHMSDALKSQVGDYASYMTSMEPLFNRLEGIKLTDTNTALATCGEHFQTIMDNIAAIDPEAAILGFESITRSANGVINAINGQGRESEGESSETNIVDSFSEAGDSIVGTIDEKISPAMDNAKNKVQEVSQEINGAEGSLLEQIQLVSSEPFEITFNVKVNGAEQIQGLTGGKYSLTGTTTNGFTEYKGTVGNAFANGYFGLPANTSNALRSEYGQPELTVYPDGTYELTTTPTLSDLPKDTVIFSEEQTKRILKNSNANSFKGKSFANGTSYLPLQDIMPDKADMFARFEANIQDNLDKMKYNISDMTSNVRDIARTVTNNMVNNNGNTVNVGDINVTCPGVTEAEVAKNLGAAIRSELNGVVSGMALRANQKAMRR